MDDLLAKCAANRHAILKASAIAFICVLVITGVTLAIYYSPIEPQLVTVVFTTPTYDTSNVIFQ